MAVDLITITAPTDEPVTTAEAKDHLRVTHTDDDAYIDALISTARQYVEGRTGIRLMTQTVELRADSFFAAGLIVGSGNDRNYDGGLQRQHFGDVISLHCAPVQSLDSIKYYDGDDVDTTLDASTYWTDLSSRPARVQTKTDWPTTNERIGNVRIRMTVGYASAGDVPKHFKQAMLLLIGHWYENREDTITGTIISNIPTGVDSILFMGGRDNQFYV